MKFRRLIFVGLILFLNSSCMDSDLPEYVKLDKLRILALEVDQPEVAAGSAVTVTPYISAVGATFPLSYTAKFCLDPSFGFGSEPTCEGLAGPTSSGTINSISDNVGAVATVGVTVPASGVIFAGRSSQDQFNGIAYLMIYTVSDSSGQQVRGFRRIIVSSKPTKNTNPVISNFLVNGSATATYPTSVSNLSLSLTPASTESYQEQLTDGSQVTRTETLQTTWFITSGEVKFFRTLGSDSTEYTPASPVPSGASIIAVTRDGRGGIDVVKITAP